MNLEEDIEQLEARMDQVRHTGIEFSQAEILRAYAVQLHLKQIARLLRASRVETSRAVGEAQKIVVPASLPIMRRTCAAPPRILQFLDRDGVAEAQMALALRAEDRTRNGGDVRLFQQNLRGGAAVLVNFLHVGKRIERARRRLALQAHFIQPGDQQIAALAILLANAAISDSGVLSAWIIAYCTGVATPLVE
jgi:hypothetical protein